MDLGKPDQMLITSEYLLGIKQQFLSQINQLNQDRDIIVSELKERILELQDTLKHERKTNDDLM